MRPFRLPVFMQGADTRLLRRADWMLKLQVLIASTREARKGKAVGDWAFARAQAMTVLLDELLEWATAMKPMRAAS